MLVYNLSMLLDNDQTFPNQRILFLLLNDYNITILVNNVLLGVRICQIPFSRVCADQRFVHFVDVPHSLR
jgi:hypothetical protein